MSTKIGTAEQGFSQGVAVTPSDSTTYTRSDAIYVAGAGDIVVTYPNNVDHTIAVPANWQARLQVIKVKAATTATGVHLFWH